MSYTGGALLYWRMSTESDLAGYKAYKGVTSHVYESPATDLGIITCSTGAPGAMISGIGNNILTYVALTAYDQTGNESTFSAEVSITKAVPILQLLRRVA